MGVGRRLDLLRRNGAVPEDVEQELLGILQGIAAVVWLLDGHQLACRALQRLTPLNPLGTEVMARHGSAEEGVLKAACIRSQVGLGADQSAGCLGVRRLHRRQHHSGHGAEGDAASDPLKRFSTARVLAEMGDAEHGAVELIRKINDGLQSAPGLRVLVAVAGNRGDHGIEDDHLQVRQLPRRLNKIRHACGGVERARLSVFPHAADEVHPTGVSTGGEKTGQEGVGNAILARPDEDISLFSHAPIRPATTGRDLCCDRYSNGGLARPRSPSEQVKLPARQPAVPDPAYWLDGEGGSREDLDRGRWRSRARRSVDRRHDGLVHIKSPTARSDYTTRHDAIPPQPRSSELASNVELPREGAGRVRCGRGASPPPPVPARPPAS